jgi:hypothetical protein
VILRFKYDTDLLDGFERMVNDQQIRNAVILAGLGSGRNYHIYQVGNRTFPSKTKAYTALAVVFLFLATCCKEWSERVDSNHRPPGPEEIGLFQAPYIQ